MKNYEKFESNVRTYCRSFPTSFAKAKNAILYDNQGLEYIDFLSGAGALNYGHNNSYMKEKLLEYIQQDNIAHGLDMYTNAKEAFIVKFHNKILKPRSLDYKLQFCGPTGTNAVEAALKLARKVKGRNHIFAFMGGFHGMTMGSLSVSSNKKNRTNLGSHIGNVTFIPYENGYTTKFDSIEYMEMLINDPHSGTETPAAIILETVQGEGGINIASIDWLIKLANFCKKYDILLISDEIQAGCGRTGTFFSFERAGINPDMVILSKSISGYGIPMSLLLIKPDLDIWTPGEHNGTFRGNQMSFVTAAAAVDFWENKIFLSNMIKNEDLISNYIKENILPLNDKLSARGIGMVHAIDFSMFANKELVNKIQEGCFESKLIIETCGRNGQVLKMMPPLTIEKIYLKKAYQLYKKQIKTHLR